MKTKIVYVLTSNENDLLLEQLMLSLYSLKYHNPEASVFLVVDQSTADTIKGDRAKVKDYLTELIVVNAPVEYNNMLRSRWIKTSLREHIEGDFLFIDSDTIITDSFEECDNWDYDIAAVIDRHILVDNSHRYYNYIKGKAKDAGWEFTDKDGKYFNSGVMYVKDNDFTHDFYRYWHKSWLEGLPNSVYQDQPTLGKANKYFNYPIHELDGIWNCQIIANGLRYLHRAKLIHYFNAERSKESRSVVYLPSDKDYYIQIRNSEFLIPDSTKSIVEDGKTAFTVNYAIIADEQLKSFWDPFTEFVFTGFFSKSKFYTLLRWVFTQYNKGKH